MTQASKITLRTGRELSLRQLTQELTYDGLIEGVPNSKFNKRQVDALVAGLRKEQPQMPLHLVTPVETPIAWGPPPYPFGSPPARLPAVTCIGRFQSWSFGTMDAEYYTTLTIVWFQNEYAMPIEPSVLDEIVGLDWDALATELLV